MEDHYSSSDEEVFFGKLADTEVSKRRRFLGSNYNSPVTPRPPRSTQLQSSNETPRSLPDVLGSANTSTPAYKQPTVERRTRLTDDSDVIILDTSKNDSNSIITLSDDESFLKNEETCSEKSVREEDECSSSTKKTVSQNEFLTTNKNNKSFTDDFDLLAEEKSLKEINNSGNRKVSLIPNSSFNNLKNNSPQQKASSSQLLNNLENNSSSLVHEIDEFVGDSDLVDVNLISSGSTNSVSHNHEMSNTPLSQNQSFETSLDKKNEEKLSSAATTSAASEECLVLRENLNITEEMPVNNATEHGKKSFDMSNLSNFEFSLNGVTDSILNLSHGSSLPSPPTTQQFARSALYQPSLYEDISCDAEQLDNQLADNQTKYPEDPDLHMSVDEMDFRQQEFSTSCSFGNSINVSQPSEYKSCPPSAHSSYSTAYDNHTTGKSNSFQDYRDISADIDLCSDVISIKSDEENECDASFTKVMQNRQNSFNATPSSKIPKTKDDGNKMKVVSKLPVPQSSRSLLRAPQFNVNPDSLKTNSLKFAKQISKVGSDKTSNLHRLEPKKSPLTSLKKPVKSTEKEISSAKEKPLAKIPTRIGTPKQEINTEIKTSSSIKSKIPSQSYLSVHKTPSNKNMIGTRPETCGKKTPAQNISNIPRAVKSDTKIKRMLTPLSSCSSNENKAVKKIPVNNKYKNVVSPIQAYIRGSPSICHDKAKVVDEVVNFQEWCKTTLCPKTPTPRTLVEPKARSVLQAKPVSKVMQKLQYENAQGQENINPNNKDMTRDTIPCIVLKPSVEVFWKEEGQPQPCMPKMGEKITKLLATPAKVKLTLHEGRVNQSPDTKGNLVPNTETTSSQNLDGDILTDQSEGRISVRIQKTVDLS